MFEAMSTQWRTGSAGATALDYNAIPVVMKALGIKSKKIRKILPDIRIMESEAISIMVEDRKNSSSKK